MFPDDTEFRFVVDSECTYFSVLSDKTITVCASPGRPRRWSSGSPGLRSDIFPMFSDAELYQPSTVNLICTRDGSDRKITLSLKQFPFLCSRVDDLQDSRFKSVVVVEGGVRRRHATTGMPDGFPGCLEKRSRVITSSMGKLR